MAIQAYSLSKEGYKQLSPHFRVREFRCRDGSDPIFVDDALVSILQKIREHFGKPLTITSGYRTPGHNKACGGAAYSQHLYGRAADFKIAGVGPDTVAAYAEQLLPGRGGIGVYPPKAGRAGGWVHVDTRASKSRWRG